ncbi:MAG: DUF5615 family PIN-like protein [Ardenticatenales bacterium]|nr:DUF5615 family PIN-like protein [Ardenticatenales bacterium]
MRFMVDESTGPVVARWLREQGHDAYSVFDDARGLIDDDVIRRAFDERRILITNDKDFGEKIYRERVPHHGVVLLRLGDERVDVKIATLRSLLHDHSERLAEQFVVVAEGRVRFGRPVR